MADRRMFARSVICTGKFLRLSPEAQALYLQLGMAADDDGAAEAFLCLRMTGFGEDVLRELENGGFIEFLLSEELVVFVSDWAVNNHIRADRYRPGRYHELVAARLSAGCQPVDSGAAQVSKGQVRPAEVSGAECEFKAPARADVEEFAVESGFDSDAVGRFFDYYEARGWRSKSGERIADWKAALRLWVSRSAQFETKGDSVSFSDLAKEGLA